MIQTAHSSDDGWSLVSAALESGASGGAGVLAGQLWNIEKVDSPEMAEIR